MTRVAIFGATSGIAQCVARLFARERANFVLVARNPQRLAAVSADLLARGAAEVATIACDLIAVETHPELVDRVLATLSGLDAVLIAHGTLGDQKRSELDGGTTTRELMTNFVSAASLLTHIANVMERQRHGVVAIIGSVAGDRGRESNYVYGSAKAGLRVFAEGLRYRLRRASVSVVLVEPGFVDTPMTAAIDKAGPLWAKPERVAGDIRRAMAKRSAVVYTPWFWRWIMLVVRWMPAPIFRRLRL